MHLRYAAFLSFKPPLPCPPQCCAAGSRVFVHESVYDEFVDKSVAAAAKRRVGDPFSSVDQGPQVDSDQFNKILHYIDRWARRGPASFLWLCGTLYPPPPPPVARCLELPAS